MGTTLTRKSIAAVVCPPEKGFVYAWDVEPRGFGVRVTRAGARAYVVTYRTRAGRKRFVTICQVAVATPEEARARARAILLAVADGKDPAQERQRARHAETMADLRRKHVEEYARAHNKPRTRQEYARQWDQVVLKSTLATRSVREITHAELAGFHTSLHATPALANQVVRMLSKAFELAATWGWRDGPNPCRGIHFYPERKRGTVLYPEELERLGAAIRAYANPAAALAIRLYLATGCRRSEIVQARFVDVDYSGSALRLPETKGGGDERVALPLELLAEIRARDDGKTEYIIPGRLAGKPMVGIYYAWKKIRAAAGFPKLRLHDLRHIFGSYASASGLDRAAVKDVMRHKSLATSERYVHGFDRDRLKNAREVAERISGSLLLGQRVNELEQPIGSQDRDDHRKDQKPDEDPE